MAMIPRERQSAMSGRAPIARPQQVGMSPQTTLATPPRVARAQSVAERAGGTRPTVAGAAVTPKRPAPVSPTRLATGTVAPQPMKAAMARAQSNPMQNQTRALTAGPRVATAQPKAAVGAPAPVATTLGGAATGVPARMMKKGGLVRKGNVSHGAYTKKC